MLGTIKLRTYWRRVDSFEMAVDDLHRLRAHIVSETEEPIRIGSKVFRFSNGFTFLRTVASLKTCILMSRLKKLLH